MLIFLFAQIYISGSIIGASDNEYGGKAKEIILAHVIIYIR